MRFHFMGLILMSATALGLAEFAQSAKPSTSGFYPIWENTAFIEGHQHLYLGTTGAHFGIQNRLHLGLNIIQWVYRTPNLFVKLKTTESESFQTALTFGYFRIQERAAKGTLSPTYTTRLDNANYAVNLLPIAFSGSFTPAEWFTLHQTVTYLQVMNSGPLKNQGTLGYSATAEFQAVSQHSLLFHAIEIGLTSHDRFISGASYRYQGETFDFRLGYFYRVKSVGQDSGPLIGFGVTL